MKTLLPIITLILFGALTLPQGIGAETKSSSSKSSATKSTRKSKSAKAKPSSSAKTKAKSTKASTTRKEEKDSDGEITQAREAARKLTTTQKSKLLSLLNEGSDEQLIEINGIAKTRSQSIIAARPFKAVEEIIAVKGIGASTYTKLLAHGKSLTSRRSSSKS